MDVTRETKDIFLSNSLLKEMILYSLHKGKEKYFTNIMSKATSEFKV